MESKDVKLVSSKGVLRSFEIGWAERILCRKDISTWALPEGSEWELMNGRLRMKPKAKAETVETEKKEENHDTGRKDSKGKGKGKAE